MDTVCFFNNKGGVGKTTLLCNAAAYIAKQYELRTLVVDADPQCNATQLVLSAEDVDALYSVSAKKGGKRETILDVLRPISRGEPKIEVKIHPTRGSSTRFGFDIIPGHPRLSLLEDRFSQAWITFGSGDLGGARQTNWASQLAAALGRRYDLVFFDVGPSLGALNRSVLVGADFFVTPMSCDIFSIMGVENISKWLTEWMAKYNRNIEECNRQNGDEDYDSFGVRVQTDQMARFSGYTVQHYIAKMERGKRRPTIAYEKIRTKIPGAVADALGKIAYKGLRTERLELGDIPNMYSLVPLAQSAHAPIHDLASADGINGAQYAQRDNYSEFIRTFVRSLLTNLDYKV